MDIASWERRRNRKSFGGRVEQGLFHRASIRSISRSISEEEAVARGSKRKGEIALEEMAGKKGQRTGTCSTRALAEPNDY